ncbi:MAG TPA: hypothetical protein VEI02_16305, partial [Planctomycetota bacterium]|nr:hypothetical protein [Planctomycetota bacterium]
LAAQAPASRPTPVLLQEAAAPLLAERTFEIPAARSPRLAIVRGARPPGGPSDAWIRIDDRIHGLASQFEYAPGRFAAAVPLRGAAPGAESAPAGSLLRVVPKGAADPKLILERVELLDAAVVDFMIRDQVTKAPLKGVAEVVAVDGATPPLVGPNAGLPTEGAAWISHDGGGELWTPLGANVAFVARASPFRGAARFRRRTDLARGLFMTFLLPPDEAPPGSRIVEASDVGAPNAVARAAKDAALGISRRADATWTVRAADEVLAAPAAFVAELVRDPARRVVVTNERGPTLVPSTAHPLVTLELPGGDLIHSNGPLPLLEDVRRDGAAVRGWVKVRCPPGATLTRLRVVVGAAELLHPLDGPATIALAVPANAGAPIALIVEGRAFADAGPIERPFAARVFTAP